jgi:hypothetical protein
LHHIDRIVPALHTKPVAKIVDRVKNAVVGIMLENNMYVPILEEPFENITDRLQTLYNSDYLEAEKAIFANRADDERLKSKMYQLEDNFYGAFSYSVRVQINEEKNFHKRNKILRIVQPATSAKTFQDAAMTTKEKREKIMDILRNEVMKGVALFQEMSPDLYLYVDNILSCSDKGNSGASYYCMKEANGQNRIFFPKKNLLNPDKDNEDIYYFKLADEILRNARIRNMILQPSVLFVRNTTEEMERRDDEVIILERDLAQFFNENT